LGQTVTAGIVSAKERIIGAGPYDDFIQTDASINPGNSGGPLFNTLGEVVGINTAILANGQGLGFAIPVNMAKEVLTQLVEEGHVTRGWMGIGIANIPPEEAKNRGLANTKGALVTQIVPGGPADQAGISEKDVIISLNGTSIDTSHTLPTLVAKLKPGTVAQVVILKEGKQYERNVILGSLDKPEESITTPKPKVSGVLGLTLRDLSASEKRLVRNGAVVVAVENNSFADTVGLRPGDLILEINGNPVTSSQKIKDFLMKVPHRRIIQMAVARGNQVYYFSFRKE
jgi:serine protease Do